MAADNDDDASRTEIDTSGPTLSREPEARTPRGGPHQAATTYAEQANEGKGTQDPYPYDPTNELLDGDDSPSADELAARGVRVSDSGRALVALDDPTGVQTLPPAHANLELTKAAEKAMRAADEASGIDPEVGTESRRNARREAGKARMQASGVKADATPPAESRTQPPVGRTTRPTTTTTTPTKSTGKS